MKALKKSISIFCAISMILGMLAGNLVTAEKVSQSMAGNVSCWWAGGSFAENRRSEYSVSSRWAYDSASDSYTRSGADTGWHDHNVAMLFGGSSYEEFIFEFDLALSEQKFNEDGTKNSAIPWGGTTCSTILSEVKVLPLPQAISNWPRSLVLKPATTALTASA